MKGSETRRSDRYLYIVSEKIHNATGLFRQVSPPGFRSDEYAMRMRHNGEAIDVSMHRLERPGTGYWPGLRIQVDICLMTVLELADKFKYCWSVLLRSPGLESNEQSLISRSVDFNAHTSTQLCLTACLGHDFDL